MSEHDEFVEEEDLTETDVVEEKAAGPQLVDLNRATVDELRQLPGIGEALAARIVNYRAEVQPFQEPADVTAVPGVSDAMYDRISDILSVSSVEPSAAEVEQEGEPEGAMADSPEEAPEPEAEEGPEAEDKEEPESVGGDESFEPEPELEEVPEPGPEADMEGDVAEEGAEDLEPEPEAEPEGEAADEGEAEGGEGPPAKAPATEMEVAPVRVITESHAKWGRLLFVGLVSALLGAVLALLAIYAVNRTLDFRTATNQAVRAEAYRLDGEMNALGGELDQLATRLDAMQDLAPVVEAAQADILALSRDLASTEAMLESVTDDLAGVQVSLAAMSEDVAGLEDEMAGLGEGLDELGQQVEALAVRVDTMDEELQSLTEAAERFDAFLDGLRQLLGESGPPGSSDLTPFPTPTAWETPTPAMEMTVIPLATPTPSE